MNSTLPNECKITGAQYLEQLSWKDLSKKEKDTFYIRRVPEWPYTNLKVCYASINVKPAGGGGGGGGEAGHGVGI